MRAEQCRFSALHHAADPERAFGAEKTRESQAGPALEDGGVIALPQEGLRGRHENDDFDASKQFGRRRTAEKAHFEGFDAPVCNFVVRRVVIVILCG
jgi:hypothetical protein